MTSRLSLLCEKILEAGWLAALITAPLFFNVYSSRVFEPDKIALVRSLALMMAGAWIVKQLEQLAAGASTPQQSGGVGAAAASFSEGVSRADALRAWVRDNPLVLATLAVVATYTIATIFSVVPSVSLFGSYQRLQGTYTTFSYVAIFFIAASTLRTRAQLDRAVNTALVTSFPIALYGLLQHFKLDPLPWGGDTTLRVASNMGNSIFVAAYLIMIVPLTLARWLNPHPPLPSPSGRGVGGEGRVFFALALVLLIAFWTFDFLLGTLFALALLLAAFLFARLSNSNLRDTLLAATYTIILAAQIVAIFFTQSRGPWLGLAGGLFTFAMLYALARGARRFVLGALALALVGAAFLALFNLPASPLDPLKRVPYLGRLGQIFETETGTGRVRELIWEGALKIITPHAPLWSPTTGDDALNALRPLVGYGPEAMYVAFNPFYPPELAQLEARNASPDRSHNETFDALVMTGLIGFAAYIALFISVFYFGLKWLGLISTPAERNAFIACWLVGGLIFALAFGWWRGWHYAGVALPAGMIAGFFLYLVARATRPLSREMGEGWGGGWLTALVAALIAHFIEIHFGIAIVSTRVYFWFFAALLVVIGMNRVSEAAPAPVIEPMVERARQTSRRRRRRTPHPQPLSQKERGVDPSLSAILTWTAIATLILMTLVYEFIGNQIGATNPLQAVQAALFSNPNGEPSGIFILFALTWLIAGVIGLSEFMRQGSRAFTVILFLALTFTALVWLALLQERALTQAGDLTNAFVGLLAQYYLALLAAVAVIAAALYFDSPRGAPIFMRSAVNAVVLPFGLIGILLLAYSTNFSAVAADIHYKSGSNYDAVGAWEQSINAYYQARELQPAQDFYSLFLGRAYLEKARAQTDANQRAAYLRMSESTLLEAQRLSPLNTDHSANLARLQRMWAGMLDDPTERAAHYQKSSDYYQAATRLAPHTAYLWNEWSQTYYQSGDLEKMRGALERSLQIDDRFAQTYFYFGEYYRAKGDAKNAAEQYFQAIARDPSALADLDSSPLAGPMSVLAQNDIAPRAIETYRAATGTYTQTLAPHYALAELYKRGGDLPKAQSALEQGIKIAPNDFVVQLQLVNFFSETGQIDAAVSAMKRAIDLIPPSRSGDLARFQQFYGQLQTLQRAMQAAQKSPNDANARRTLAALWKARGQPEFALPEYQTVARLLPNDYDAQKNIALLSLQTFKLDDAQRALVAASALVTDTEKLLWQNLQAALNAQKAQNYAGAIKSAQAALALAGDADKPVIQAYLVKLLELK